MPCDPTAADTKNKGFITRWDRIKQSKEVQLYDRIHSDICNVPLYLIPGVRMQIRLTKTKSSIYLMNKADSTTVFKFLDAKLLVNCVRPSPSFLLAHNTTLARSALARSNLTRVELKTYTFSSGSQSLSIDNAVLGPLPKRLLFTMVKNADFLGSVTTNPCNFRHYDLSSFAQNVNGKHTRGGSIAGDASREDFGHGIQDRLRRVGYPSLELRSPDNSRHVHNRLLHATLRPDARPRRLGRTYLTSGQWQYQGGIEISQAATRTHYAHILSRI